MEDRAFPGLFETESRQVTVIVGDVVARYIAVLFCALTVLAACSPEDAGGLRTSAVPVPQRGETTTTSQNVTAEVTAAGGLTEKELRERVFLIMVQSSDLASPEVLEAYSDDFLLEIGYTHARLFEAGYDDGVPPHETASELLRAITTANPGGGLEWLRFASAVVIPSVQLVTREEVADYAFLVLDSFAAQLEPVLTVLEGA